MQQDRRPQNDGDEDARDTPGTDLERIEPEQQATPERQRPATGAAPAEPPPPPPPPDEGLIDVNRMAALPPGADGPAIRRRQRRGRRERAVEVFGGSAAVLRALQVLTEDPTRPIRHDVTFDTDAPADETLSLAEHFVEAVRGVVPARPELAQLKRGNSFTLQLYAPAVEIREARGRREVLERDDLPLEPTVLPDTDLGVLALTSAFALPEPREMVRRVRSVSPGAADSLRGLVAELKKTETSIRLWAPEDRVLLTPDRAEVIRERLDDAEDEEPVTVTVLGVLEGANSRGDGSFELRPDEDVQVPYAIRQRSRTDPIRGLLTAESRDAIKEQGLWDRHVEADIKVVRQRRGDSIRVAGRWLVAVRPRFE